MKYIRLFVVSIAACLLFACSSMDEHYKDLIKDGEIRYASIVGDPVFYSGYKRAVLEFQVSDANVSEVKVFWNNNTQSKELVIDQTGKHSIEITDLKEQSYSFTLYSYNGTGGFSSMGVNVTGRIYGDTYLSNILSRPITSATSGGISIVNLAWGAADTECIGTEISYTNEDGDNTVIFVDSKANATRLDDVKLSADMTYRSLYMPEAQMVDTFKTEYRKITIQ